MKIAYIENIRLPTEKAHGIQIMKMCEAFAMEGNEVMLFVSGRNTLPQQDPFDFYNVKRIFEIKKIKVPNTIWFGRLGFLFQEMIFSEIASWSIAKFGPDIVYSRDERILFNYLLRFRNLIWESHRGSWNILTRIVSKYVKKIVVISHGLEEFYAKKGQNISKKIIYAPDGVDIEKFSVNISKDECREKLGLPVDKTIVLYSGHLYSWKGADVLAKSVKYLPDNILTVFVGGTKWDTDNFVKLYGDDNRILILGQKKADLIPLYLKSADVLVIPNSAKSDISRLYTSPLKLFEYMASNIPIVASDIPSIREILNEQNAMFAEPDNTPNLAHTIRTMLSDKAKMIALSTQARYDVEHYTWIKRSQNIIQCLSKIT